MIILTFRNAPLAQLVEQLTLNQWVPGSNPRRCTKSGRCVAVIVSVFNAEGPPVPIPNTEVKLCSAENTCRATGREDKSMPTHHRKTVKYILFSCLCINPNGLIRFASLAQLAEHVTVNHGVVGSSPSRGAILGQQFCTPTQKSLFYKGFSCF